MDRGTFFHAIYQIEQKLGQVFAELEPYALFPVDEYFGGAVRKEPVRATTPASSPNRSRLRVPLLRTA
jgi:hypothetical protein